MRSLFLLLSFVLARAVFAQTVPPVAADDMFNTVPGGALTVETPGVLANDTDADGDSLAAMLVSEPANGTVTLNRDGSFTYTPNAGFTGADSFTYVAEEVRPELFIVDQMQSRIRFQAILNTALGNDTDSDSSSVTGMITADVTPNTTPFAEIHLTAMDMALADSMTLSYGFGFGGRLDIDTVPDDVRVTIAQPGAPALVADSSFVQTGTLLSLPSTLTVDASGLISAFVADGPQQIDPMAETDLSGFITQRDTTLRLALPLQFEGTFDVAGNEVVMNVEGFIIATAPVLPPPLTSNAATVSVNVAVNTAAEDAGDVPAQFVLEQNYPNPFNPVTTIGFALSSPSDVSLSVFDVLGRKVATLVEAHRGAGRHTVRFDASALPGGVYVYRLRAESFTATKTLVVLK